jgi:ABC-type antimicrobial peptide transport system permease subunit
MDQAHDQPENPWSLLNSAIPNDVIPVIGDEAAVKWQLHSGLGKSITISDEAGRQVDLQFVALLKGSALQSELIISEANFRKLFPSIEGHSFFLIESQSIDDKEITTGLEDCLSPFSFDAEPVAGRLSAYVSVQNTYLSTFQMLGGFGLLLGTLGITVVMLRNIWERRGELALMEALGFRRNMLWWLMMAENVWLVLLGIGSGALSAAVPVVPLLIGQREEIDLASILGLICMVIGIGVVSGWATLSPTLRKLSIRDLRQE